MFLIPLLFNAVVAHTKNCSALLNTHTHIHSRLLGAWRRGPEGTQLSCVIYQRSLPHQFLSSESIHSMRRATSPSSDRDTSSGMSEAARKALCSSQRPSVAVTEISVWLNTCRSIREADGPTIRGLCLCEANLAMLPIDTLIYSMLYRKAIYTWIMLFILVVSFNIHAGIYFFPSYSSLKNMSLFVCFPAR